MGLFNSKNLATCLDGTLEIGSQIDIGCELKLILTCKRQVRYFSERDVPAPENTDNQIDHIQEEHPISRSNSAKQ